MCVIRSDSDDDAAMTRLETLACDGTKRLSLGKKVSHRKNAVYARRDHRNSRLVPYAPLGERAPTKPKLGFWLGLRVH